MSVLELEAVGKSYGAVRAVDSISLTVAEGGRTAIVGPSASGKTTLLRLIAGFEMPDTGTIAIAGEVVAEGSRGLPAHRRGVGYVTQDGALFPHLTVAQNVAFGLDAGPEREHRTLELLALVELDPAVAGRRPDQLSGGQQQRVALARALARKPRLMLLDEPFSALDSGLRAATRRAVMDVLEAAGVSSILVTHDHEEALSFADQVAVLLGGRLAQLGPPLEVYARPRSEAVARLLGEALILPATISGGYADTPLGRLPVDGVADGPGRTVLLRPEQVRVAALPEGAAADGAVGEVVAVEFAGGRGQVTVRLVRPAGDSAGDSRPDGDLMVFRQPGMMLPTVGARARFVIEGPAYVLPDDARDD